MKRESSITVRSIMRAPVWGFEDELVSAIVEKMIKNDIGAVILTSQDMPVGIITESDIVTKIVHARRDPKKTFAKDIMSSPVVTIRPDESLSDALRLMHEKKVRRLVVVDMHVVGIVTIRRILNALVTAKSR